MSAPLPAVPIWFPRVTHELVAYEQFMGIFGATIRKKQLERLKESHKLELTCRSYGPGVVKLYARLLPHDPDALSIVRPR